METVEVFMNEGGTITVKNEVMGTDQCLVTFTAEQADLVCKWIQEVKAEIEDLPEEE
jgi:hypothetical protein